MLVLGAAALVAVYVPLWRRQPAGAVVVQAGGGVLALGAALLSLGGVPMPVLLPWLAGFLILTISGERLELARVALLAPHAEMLAVGASALIAAGALATLLLAGRRLPAARGRDAGAHRLAHPVRRGPPHRHYDRTPAVHGRVPARRLRLAGPGRRRLAGRRADASPVPGTTRPCMPCSWGL